MKIYFKNGMVAEIAEDISEIMDERILEGSSKFQPFYDEFGRLVLIVNLDEVVYIDNK